MKGPPSRSTRRRYASCWNAFLLPPATKLGQGNSLRSVARILSTGGGAVCWGGGGVWQGGKCGRGMHGSGACMAVGHAWQGGMRGRGACVAGGHAW